MAGPRIFWASSKVIVRAFMAGETLEPHNGYWEDLLGWAIGRRMFQESLPGNAVLPALHCTAAPHLRHEIEQFASDEPGVNALATDFASKGACRETVGHARFAAARGRGAFRGAGPGWLGLHRCYLGINVSVDGVQ